MSLKQTLRSLYPLGVVSPLTWGPHAFHVMEDLNTIFDCILPLLRCLLVNILARQGNGGRTQVQSVCLHTLGSSC